MFLIYFVALSVQKFIIIDKLLKTSKAEQVLPLEMPHFLQCFFVLLFSHSCESKDRQFWSGVFSCKTILDTACTFATLPLYWLDFVKMQSKLNFLLIRGVLILINVSSFLLSHTFTILCSVLNWYFAVNILAGRFTCILHWWGTFLSISVKKNIYSVKTIQ